MNHFKLSEMACKDGTPYPEEYVEKRWKAKLLPTLNAIREEWGVAIDVVSGYRTPEYNRKVGGVPKSQHVQGLAADLIPRGGTPGQLHAMILGMYQEGKLPHLRGLGQYTKFVHVDTRPGKRLARWQG